MAGSFGLFRQYERMALAALAIMAMLAFFVLPPFLQMGAGRGGPDPVAVEWKGGGLRESGLRRAVWQRKAMNQFLVTALAMSGQDPSRVRLPDDEADVVDTLVLAKEAEANGIVVSNDAINQFLKDWTNDLVKPQQFEQIVSAIGSRTGISQSDIFDAMRTALMARRVEMLLVGGLGFAGAPPGLRWDYFRRLEQGATVEAVPVVVEHFIDKVPEPSEEALRKFFERFQDELPVARSADPGFKQPHRVRYDVLVAKADVFHDEEKAKITDEQVKAFYDERKATLYKAKTEESSTDGDAAAGDAKDADAESKQPADEGKAGDDKAGAATNDGASSTGRLRVRTVAFKQPSGDAGKDAEKDAGTGADAAAATSAEAASADDGEFEPLDKVRDDIVERLTDEAVERRIGAIFDAVKTDVAKYGESLALWQVEGEGSGQAPTPPSVKAIAATQGLDGSTSDLVSASDAMAAGGVGGSFQFSVSREFGVRQQRWVDLMFGRNVPLLQTVTTRDIDGNRYLSWKTEDQPEFVPSFQTAREEVLRAWRIVEARPLARKAAEELVTEAKQGKTLAEVAAARGGLEVENVGPFTWLSRGTAPFGSAPELSQPNGLAMPGTEIMEAVFSLEAGQAAAAFNEPQTVCYAVRVVSLEPEEAQLRELFLAASQDPRRLETVAESDVREAYDRWVASVKEKHALAWQRDPRAAEFE